MVSQLIFGISLLVAIYFLRKGFLRIRKNILMGKNILIEGDSENRLKMMFLVAFGQKKMFDRPIPALLHLCVYIGFLIINIEMLEIIIDGLLGTHRIFYVILGSTYLFLISCFEFLAVAVLLACVVFLIRRFVLKLGRFNKPELKEFPTQDATIILVTEILLMSAFMIMNASDSILQKMYEHYTPVGAFYFSSFLIPFLEGVSPAKLLFLERFSWWFHILGVFAFANYLPFSKHLHIVLAFPNTYYANLHPAGKISNMSDVTREVKSLMGLEENTSTEPMGRLGAKDIQDLSWKDLLSAYSCTECGRCTSVCPANITGKLLSPRKIMMDTRDRMEEIGYNCEQNKGVFVEDNKSLLGDYIKKEEVFACTTCNACVDACPINISPVDIIIQLRRYVVMEESKAPDSWNRMFSNIENNFAPWKFSSSDRGNWMNNV